MKLARLLWVLLSISAIDVVAQNLYYDALTIRENIDIDPEHPGTKTISKDQAALLAPYFKITDHHDGQVIKALNDSLKKNPFFKNYQVNGGELSSDLGKGSNLLTGIAGIDVTQFADGLAQFMIERSKEELNVAFFQKFKTYLEKHPEFQVLFPYTTNFLSGILAYEYTQLIGGLRDAFYSDLKNLVSNLDDLFLLPKYEKVVHDFPEILVVIRTIQIISDIENSKNPAEVIHDLASMPEWQGVDTLTSRGASKNLHNLLKVTDLFSQGLRFHPGVKELITLPEGTITQEDSALVSISRDPAKTRTKLATWKLQPTWVTYRHFEVLFKDSLAFNIFMGLFYQQASNGDIKFIVNGAEKKMTKFLAMHAQDVFFLRGLVIDFVKLSEEVDEALQTIQTKKELTASDYNHYIGTSIDVVEYGFRLMPLVGGKFDGADYIDIARSGNALYRNVYEKNYAAAVSNAIGIIEKVTEVITPSNKTSRSRFSDLNRSASGVLKYGVLMANVVDAKSPQEIKDAIANAALPTGSSAYRKYQQFTLSVNSYFGAYARLDPVDHVKRIWDQPVGVIAPVGLALNHGLGTYGSISAFIPLLDIGAIADFRLKNDSTALTEQIKLGNIFSPGGYLVYGLGANIPMALGIGAQYGPGLYSIEVDDKNGTKNYYQNPDWRVNVFLVVDIPLFNLTRGRKLKSN